MAKTKLVDGTEDLAAQERALNFLEQTMFAKVTAYVKKANGGADATNTATLEDVPIGQQPGPLHLEAIAPNADPAPVIAKQKQAGKELAFKGVAFVSSAEKLVLAFR